VDREPRRTIVRDPEPQAEPATDKEDKCPQLAPYRWKPGETGNPNGRTPLVRELDAIRGKTRRESMLAIARTMLYTRDQMKAVAADPSATMVELMVASVMKKAIDTGCPQRAAFLLAYILGKPETSVERDPPASDVEKQAKSTLEALPTSMIIDLVKASDGVRK
jgi:hypothetical protein